MSVRLVIPEFGEGSGQGRGTIVSIAIGIGDRLGVGDPVLEVETDKVTMEIPAESAGVVTSVLVNVGDEVRPGQACVELESGLEFRTAGADPAQEIAVPGKPASRVPAPARSDTLPTGDVARTVMPAPAGEARAAGTIPAGPSTRRLARELGVELGQIRGTGPRGRILPQDVKCAVRRVLAARAGAAVNPAPAADPVPDPARYGQVRRVAMTAMQRATGTNMARAWRQVPHAWLEESADVTDLEEWRRRHADTVRETGGNLTLTVIIAKAAACALRDCPGLNCVIDEVAQEIVYREYFNIGIAVDTPHGLLVPTLREVDRKGLAALARELTLLARKANERSLTSAEMEGAGFTISNLGGHGLDRILPVVNWPQVAILGVAAAREVPVCRDGGILPRRMLPMTLGFDHRIINGADGARFIARIRDLLEDPRSMLN